MAYDLEGKTAMVSGGSGGIGIAICLELARSGASVSISARTPASVAQAVEDVERVATQTGAGGHAFGVVADLSTAEGCTKFVEQTVQQFGGVDMLVCCHGGSRSAPFLELPDENLIEAWQNKLLGGIRLTRAVVPIMEKRGGGSVVLISGGRFGPDVRMVPSWSTNGAQRGWVSAVAEDLAHRGIAINIVNPGNVNTRRIGDANERIAEERGITAEEVMRERRAGFVTGHLTEASEIGDIVAFLCARRVINIIGQEIDAFTTF